MDSSVTSSGDDEVAALVKQISTAAREISAAVSGAVLTGLIGATGSVNIQGEKVQQLDALADGQLTKILRDGKRCAGVGSEEKDHILVFDNEVSKQSRYVVLFDPLDGSDNIDTSLPVGTIFGIYNRKSKRGTACDLSDFLQPGSRQVAAGYCLYGCATIFVFATRDGVNGFTLHPATGEFQLSHPGLRCPENGCIYSVNGGYHYQYSGAVQKFIHSCQQRKEEEAVYTQRYVGSMVADVHRTLLMGGIFMYPATRHKANGKLRLLYECNPLSFIMEVAGGGATNGQRRILDIKPASLHEVTPIYLGSSAMIRKLMESLSASAVRSVSTS